MKELQADLSVSEVTLFEDRARVRRSGMLELPEGLLEVVISDVSPLISDRTLDVSLGVEGGGKLTVGSLSVDRSFRSREERLDDIVGIEEKLEKKQAALKELTDRLDSLGVSYETRRRILDLSSAEIPVDIAAGRSPDEKKWARWEELDETLASLALDRFDIGIEIEKLNTEICDLENLQEVNSSPSDRCAATLRADISVETAGRYSFAVEYIVPGACWRPKHRAILLGETLRFETDACIWQNTGEDWKDVQLSFSTHRPSTGMRPPLLSDDILSVVKKAKEDLVEIREQSIDDSGLGGSAADPSGDSSLPGVEDGGIVRTFQAASPGNIPSNGRPYRVAIGSFECTGVSDITMMPELSPYAFARSLQSNTAAYPVLAGPVDLIRENGFLGRTLVMYVAPGEKFALGWGPDPELRVHRAESTQSREAGGLNVWERCEYTVELRLSNIGSKVKTMTVRERIPVSEMERVRIRFDSEATSDAYSGPDDDGIIEWQVTLQAFGRKKLVLVYGMETHKKVVGI